MVTDGKSQPAHREQGSCGEDQYLGGGGPRMPGGGPPRIGGAPYPWGGPPPYPRPPGAMFMGPGPPTPRIGPDKPGAPGGGIPRPAARPMPMPGIAAAIGTRA